MLLSIMQGIFNKKSDTALNELVLKAKRGDKEVMDDLLIAYTPFIIKTASFVCKRFVDEHDDEFSIAMSGFHEAILQFNPEDNSSLTTFSHLIIKRRLIDHFRKEATRNDVIHLLKGEDETAASDAQRYVLDQASILSYSSEQQAVERREEIMEYTKLLKDFGLSFHELSRSSPKHTDSRKTALQIAQIIAETPDFYSYLMVNKKLPMKELESTVEVSRKTIERHRKYIISVTLLLNSHFVYIQEYIKGELI
ncbi:RNA polymerase sigma-I factor [Sporosarcina sp. YIM B06819]|uniref:RNA polymerase sigma-I factor n=1 Tax=Sporosarcina sp. YIM B06819 TaxID=3081769 RepID=UPI00298CC930|nr:RNA polymerase sigma-I factor [Sporosarcina sp. YIM B06819]